MGGEATREMAVRAIRRLHRAGHEALLAGGCVRDMLLGLRPADYDVATSATPRQVRRLFRHVLMVGAKFGVAMVIEGGRRLEVTTFRHDVSYTDGRRPDRVRFVSAREDAVRRDFTINGMFYDVLAEKVVDYVDGQTDLSAGVIRAIGAPRQRFAEDYLRMLRAVRFAERFGFRIEPATADAVRDNAARIVQISGERVRDELEKMLARDSAGRAIRRLRELEILPHILPELFESPELYPAALQRVEQVAERKDALLTMTALLCGLPREAIGRVTRRWGCSKQVRNSLTWAAEHLNDWQTLPEAPLAELKRVLAGRQFELLEVLWRIQEEAAAGTTHNCQLIRRRISRIDPAQVAPPALLRGAHLKKLGLRQGPQVGQVLAQVYEAQLNEQLRTRREALQLARRLLAQSAPGAGDGAR